MTNKYCVDIPLPLNDPFVRSMANRSDHWWNNRSSLEKKLLVSSLTLLLILISVITFVATLHSDDNLLAYYIQNRKDVAEPNALRLDLFATANRVWPMERKKSSRLCLTPACIETGMFGHDFTHWSLNRLSLVPNQRTYSWAIWTGVYIPAKTSIGDFDYLQSHIFKIRN